MCNQLLVYEWQNAAAGDQVAVLDEVFTYETAAESRTVTAVGDPDGSGQRIITLNSGLSLAYLASLSTESEPFQPTFGLGADGQRHSAGFGVISGCDLTPNQINQVGSGGTLPSCFYDPDMRGIERPFGDAFVEFKAPRDGMGAVPYISETWFTQYGTGTHLSDLSETWYEHYSGSARDVRTNYFHLIGATKLMIGSTFVLGGSWRSQNWSYMFEEGLEEYGGLHGGDFRQTGYLSQYTTTHEFGHLFGVNECDGGNGHDARNAWCTDHCEPGVVQMRNCIMAPATSIEPTDWDGYDRFCKEDLFLGCGGSSAPREHAIRIEDEPVKNSEAIQ